LVLEQAIGSIRVPASEIDSIEQLIDPVAASDASAVVSIPGFTANARVRVVSRAEAERLIAAASDAEGLPAPFVLSVAHVESAFVAEARSQKGAIGLMQLMPETADALGVSAAEPTENAQGGARYLRELLVRYRGDARLALAAYNAGPGAVDRFGGIPPFRETQLYVDRVLREYAVRLSQERARASGPRSTQAPKSLSGQQGGTP
jgi:soluble lytic murein transglycosylase-like protein